jgi:hypothetical protein
MSVSNFRNSAEAKYRLRRRRAVDRVELYRKAGFDMTPLIHRQLPHLGDWQLRGMLDGEIPPDGEKLRAAYEALWDTFCEQNCDIVEMHNLCKRYSDQSAEMYRLLQSALAISENPEGALEGLERIKPKFDVS